MFIILLSMFIVTYKCVKFNIYYVYENQRNLCCPKLEVILRQEPSQLSR